MGIEHTSWECEAKLGYCVLLGPLLFGNAPHPLVLYPTYNISLSSFTCWRVAFLLSCKLCELKVQLGCCLLLVKETFRELSKNIPQGGKELVVKLHNWLSWESPHLNWLSNHKLQVITFLSFCNLIVSIRYQWISFTQWYCNPSLLRWKCHNNPLHGWKEGIPIQGQLCPVIPTPHLGYFQ
jgi:hypothetical protein